MESLFSSPAAWIVAAVAAAVGFAIGRGSNAAARKARALEAQLGAERAAHEETRREAAGYRKQVADHFVETSERLHDLTLQYRAVYEHLAKGASELCPEGLAKLDGGLGLDALPEEAEDTAPAPAAAAEHPPE